MLQNRKLWKESVYTALQQRGIKARKFPWLGAVILASFLAMAGCNAEPSAKEPTGEEKLRIVATTTMLADMARVLGGDAVEVKGLMGPGVDPHLYQASAGDVSAMQKAEVVLYGGLHLEGKMGEIFENLPKEKVHVICAADGLDPADLIEENGSVDPHVWFDVTLWKKEASYVAMKLEEADPEHQKLYQKNLEQYLLELEDLDIYLKAKTLEVDRGQRILVTAHDAFSYFARAYGFEVESIQGVSTEAEAGTADISKLADFITEHKIKAIFVESSVPPKTIESLQDAVKSRGAEVNVGGELYSDSLGDEKSGAATYILTCKANMDTIVKALK